MLAAELDAVTLAMPGSAMPAEQLAAAELPSLPVMVADALDEDCDYARGTSVSAQAGKKSEQRSRPPPQPPPGPQPYHHRSPHGSPQRGSPQHGSPGRSPAGESSAPQASSSDPQSSPFQERAAGGAAAHGAEKDLPEADSAAAAAQQQRSERHARWKQRMAGVIHVHTHQPGEAAGHSMPTGVVSVQLPDDAQAGSAPAGTALQADATQPAAGHPAADQQHAVGGASSAPAEIAAERAGGMRAQGLDRTDGRPAGHSPGPHPAQHWQGPRQVQMVQLSTGGRRPISPLRPALKPGQTPFGMPHVQQRPLDGSQGCVHSLL